MKLAAWPATTTWLAGWATMAGGATTVTALPLVTLPTGLLTTTE